jgi:hypothetical protein
VEPSSTLGRASKNTVQWYFGKLNHHHEVQTMRLHKLFEIGPKYAATATLAPEATAVALPPTSLAVLLNGREPNFQQKILASRVSTVVFFSRRMRSKHDFFRALTKPLSGDEATVPTAQAAQFLDRLLSYAASERDKIILKEVVRDHLQDTQFVRDFANMAANSEQTWLSARYWANTRGFAEVLDRIFAHHIQARRTAALGNTKPKNSALEGPILALVEARTQVSLRDDFRPHDIRRHPFQCIPSIHTLVTADFLAQPTMDLAGNICAVEVNELLTKLFQRTKGQANKQALGNALVANAVANNYRNSFMSSLGTLACCRSFPMTELESDASQVVANNKEMAAVLDKIFAVPIEARVAQWVGTVPGWALFNTVLVKPIQLLVDARAKAQVANLSKLNSSTQRFLDVLDSLEVHHVRQPQSVKNSLHLPTQVVQLLTELLQAASTDHDKAALKHAMVWNLRKGVDLERLFSDLVVSLENSPAQVGRAARKIGSCAQLGGIVGRVFAQPIAAFVAAQSLGKAPPEVVGGRVEPLVKARARHVAWERLGSSIGEDNCVAARQAMLLLGPREKCSALLRSPLTSVATRQSVIEKLGSHVGFLSEAESVWVLAALQHATLGTRNPDYGPDEEFMDGWPLSCDPAVALNQTILHERQRRYLSRAV